MKVWIAIFSAGALVAAFLGFAGMTEGAAAIAKVMVIGFVLLAVIALVGEPRRRRGA